MANQFAPPVFVRLLEARNKSLRSHFEKLMASNTEAGMVSPSGKKIQSLTVGEDELALSNNLRTGGDKQRDSSAAKKRKI